LPRAFVVENQRARILSAVADVTSVAGYREMTVEGVIVTAGVSRRTFYEHFKGKDEAFLAAFDAVLAQLLSTVRDAAEREKHGADRLRAGLAAFLDFVAREPAFARMCVVEALAAGSEAVKRRNAAMATFARIIDENARELGAALDPPALTAETIVGGIYEVIYSRVVRGDIRELPLLLPDLMWSALLPYAGPEAALAEYRRLQQQFATTP
jgi:AcrR family transcriptional regulator